MPPGRGHDDREAVAALALCHRGELVQVVVEPSEDRTSVGTVALDLHAKLQVRAPFAHLHERITGRVVAADE